MYLTRPCPFQAVAATTPNLKARAGFILEAMDMGYFSNGTEGMFYEEEYCVKCLHYGDERKGCPVWGAHLLYNYERGTDAASILDILIPRFKDKCGNDKCSMFLQDPHYGQMPIAFKDAENG